MHNSVVDDQEVAITHINSYLLEFQIFELFFEKISRLKFLPIYSYMKIYFQLYIHNELIF